LEAIDGLRIRDLRSGLAGPFDLDVGSGHLAVISGASGSGKSLLLRMVADLDPNQGKVDLGDVSRASLPAPAWRTRAPYVAAESAWWTDAVVDHFAPAHRASAKVLAERLGVGARQWEGPVLRLSTGERQRLSLVRALVLDSPLLLLDEPTGPLDPVATSAVEALLIERAASGTVVLMVSHDPNQAERLNAARYRMADRRLEPLS
jgi:ABC-type lipoprotein export system ATPase subunit